MDEKRTADASRAKEADLDTDDMKRGMEKAAKDSEALTSALRLLDQEIATSSTEHKKLVEQVRAPGAPDATPLPPFARRGVACAVAPRAQRSRPALTLWPLKQAAL